MAEVHEKRECGKVTARVDGSHAGMTEYPTHKQLRATGAQMKTWPCALRLRKNRSEVRANMRRTGTTGGMPPYKCSGLRVGVGGYVEGLDSLRFSGGA